MEITEEIQDKINYIDYLKRKNQSQEPTRKKKKTRDPEDSTMDAKITVRQQANPPNSTTEKTQKIRRKDRPPPINILYQDPKDTVKLLKSTIKDTNNFQIKRINNGKHTLQVDNINNFNAVKELLVKCNLKFYTYTAKTEKPTTLLKA